MKYGATGRYITGLARGKTPRVPSLPTISMMNLGDSVEQWQELLQRLLEDLYREAAALGSTIRREHGIGHKGKAARIELMRGIKRALDPNGILNPGKIFD